MGRLMIPAAERFNASTGDTAVIPPPTLPAVASDDGKIASVWCRYCDRFHTHGNLPGHRVAHCVVEDSPYRDRGYVLELVVGTQKSLKPPAAERRKPRRQKRFLGYVLVHGWDEERPTPIRSRVTSLENRSGRHR